MDGESSKKSELPKGAQPYRYARGPVRQNPYAESFSSGVAADEADAAAFRARHPESEARVDEFIDERFREQKTGVVLDTALLDDITMLVDLGLQAMPDRYPTPHHYLKDHDQYLMLMEYLKHLAATGHTDAEIIRNKIENFHGLTLNEAHALRKYLLERAKLME